MPTNYYQPPVEDREYKIQTNGACFKILQKSIKIKRTWYGKLVNKDVSWVVHVKTHLHCSNIYFDDYNSAVEEVEQLKRKDLMEKGIWIDA